MTPINSIETTTWELDAGFSRDSASGIVVISGMVLDFEIHRKFPQLGPEDQLTLLGPLSLVLIPARATSRSGEVVKIPLMVH